MRTPTLRKILPKDDAEVGNIIRKVMTEHRACGAGFAIHDPEVNEMSQVYRGKKSFYYVISDGEKVLGGGGIGPLKGADAKTCELRKMYFLPEVRGLGFGKLLLEICLEEAKRCGYKRCYLETLKSMQVARSLYEKLGFKKLSAPMGATGHFSCDSWYIKEL